MQNKVSLSKFNNKAFDRGASKVKELVWIFLSALLFRSSMPFANALKIRVLKLFGAKLGYNIVLKPRLTIKFPWKLTICNNVWLGEDVWIDNLDEVIIRDNVCLSQGAMLLCGNHNYKKSTFDLIIGRIVIEEGAWIGAKTVVCPGVTCHSHSILTVGSIATNDLQKFSIYQGNPAIKIKERIISE